MTAITVPGNFARNCSSHSTLSASRHYWYAVSTLDLRGESSLSDTSTAVAPSISTTTTGPQRPSGLSAVESSVLARFGPETNWLDVVQEYYSTSVVLLKQDGTLWRLGTNSFSGKLEWPGERIGRVAFLAQSPPVSQMGPGHADHSGVERDGQDRPYRNISQPGTPAGHRFGVRLL